MSNERKTGWATITYRDGSSVTGEIKRWDGYSPVVRMLEETWTVVAENTTITYIERPLPTKPGSVIEAGDGVRFMRTSGVSQNCWSHTETIDGLEWTTTNGVSAYCREHGGFTILVEGK